MIIDRCVYSVQEALEEIAVLNPDYEHVILTPTSFVYFIRGLGSNVKLFCTWRDKKAKILHYFSGAVDINIRIDPLSKPETAFFENETGDVLEVRLSG